MNMGSKCPKCGHQKNFWGRCTNIKCSEKPAVTPSTRSRSEPKSSDDSPDMDFTLPSSCDSGDGGGGGGGGD